MPKRKSEHLDEEDEIPTNKKKAPSGDGDSTVACELSKNRKVLVKKFKGKVYVVIREFYNKGGEDLPGKKDCPVAMAVQGLWVSLPKSNCIPPGVAIYTNSQRKMGHGFKATICSLFLALALLP